ncbi:MAG: glycosyltransferase family 4 protein [Erythrobacter sp.]
MRALLVHNNFGVQGGAEVFFHEIGRLLEAHGHDVAKFSCAEEGLDAPYAEDFPEVSHYADGGILAKAVRVPSIIYNRDARDKMAKVIAEFRPDIVHGFAIYGRLTPAVLDAAKDAQVPVVLSCNDYKHICPNYKLFHHGRVCEDCKAGQFINAVKNRCCHNSLPVSAASALEAYVHAGMDIWRKNVDRFLFASQFMASKTEEFWGEGRIQLDFLQNPFDASAHHVEPNAGQSILYFGRLIEEKGVGHLIEAARLRPDVHVTIVGDGPDRTQIERASAQLDNVRFVGPAWGDDLKQHLFEARAVVVPSLWHENFPYVILQAFAAGKPVIGSRRGGIPELVESGPHGWLYEAEQVDQLAEVMAGVCAQKDAKILEMGDKARRYVAATFNDDAIFAQLSRIYAEVIQ